MKKGQSPPQAGGGGRCQSCQWATSQVCEEAEGGPKDTDKYEQDDATAQ